MEMSAKVDDDGAEEEREEGIVQQTLERAAAASLSLRRSVPNLTSHCPGYRMPPNLGRTVGRAREIPPPGGQAPHRGAEESGRSRGDVGPIPNPTEY